MQLGCNYAAYNAPHTTDGNRQHLVITREEAGGQYTLAYYLNTVNVFQTGPSTSANLGTNVQSLATSQGIWIGDDYTSRGFIGKLTQLSTRR